MTSYAIISDVHSNLEALQAALAAIEKDSPDALLFLGDSVGYGPSPNECITLLRANTEVILAGNHDRGAIDPLEKIFFNPHAKTAIEWTRSELSSENLSFLEDLPLSMEKPEDNIFLVHSTPYEPEMWHYFSSAEDAYVNLPRFKEQICFLGHSHMPFITECSPDLRIRFIYDRADIKSDHRYIVNAGSIGQPRDGNPDASYALFKDGAIEIKRVPYDIVLTQNKIHKAGLPKILADRLALGR